MWDKDNLRNTNFGVLLQFPSPAPIIVMTDLHQKKNWGILKLHLKGTAAEDSTYKLITYDFNNGDRIDVGCYHYSDAPQRNHLKISMSSKEFVKYIGHIAEPANN